MKFAWRWFAALIAIVVGLAAVVGARIIVHGGGPGPVVEFVAEMALWTTLWWIASWIVLNRGISLWELFPGSILAGVGFAIAGLFGRTVLPMILADSALRFGVLGMAFTYIGWLLVLAWILLIAAAVGRILHLTRIGRGWRRSTSFHDNAR
jgi:membrane protein